MNLTLGHCSLEMFRVFGSCTIVKNEPLESAQSPEIVQSSSRDLGVAKVQLSKLGQSLETHQSSVSDLSASKPQFLQLVQPLEIG